MRWLFLLCLLSLLPLAFSAKHAPPLAIPVQPAEWKHYTMDDLGLDVTRFQPVRGRYLQEMLDLEGREETQSRGFVHLEVDQARHSGPWRNQEPAPRDPWREPGLVVDWKIQNGLYNAYDRVLTDSRLSTIYRVMPASPYGLIIGTTLNQEHARLRAPLDEPDDSFAVTRRSLPHGAVNVLTVPYVLAAMDLHPGDRFTLPGFALIGGPEGNGRRWRGAFEVLSRTQRTVQGEVHQVTEVRQWAVAPERIDALSGAVPPPAPGTRFTRHLVSDRAPYFIGRGDYLVREAGPPVRIREQLDLIAWAPMPLSAAELIGRDVWAVDSTAGVFFQLKPQHTPAVALPRDP